MFEELNKSLVSPRRSFDQSPLAPLLAPCYPRPMSHPLSPLIRFLVPFFRYPSPGDPLQINGVHLGTVLHLSQTPGSGMIWAWVSHRADLGPDSWLQFLPPGQTIKIVNDDGEWNVFRTDPMGNRFRMTGDSFLSAVNAVEIPVE